MSNCWHSIELRSIYYFSRAIFVPNLFASLTTILFQRLSDLAVFHSFLYSSPPDNLPVLLRGPGCRHGKTRLSAARLTSPWEGCPSVDPSVLRVVPIGGTKGNEQVLPAGFRPCQGVCDCRRTVRCPWLMHQFDLSVLAFKHGSLNGYHKTHALRERARKLSQGILIIRSVLPKPPPRVYMCAPADVWAEVRCT